MDDLAITSDSFEEAKAIVKELNDYFDWVGLQITPDPTKTVILSNSPTPLQITLNQRGNQTTILGFISI